MAVISWLPTGAAKSEPVVEPIMITVESAVSDTLTVMAVGQEPQTCVTDVNGIGTMSLMPDYEYTFTSSVAKALDDSGDDYAKKITLTRSTDVVKVMPDVIVEWYGNRKDTLSSVLSYNYSPDHYLSLNCSLGVNETIITMPNSGSGDYAGSAVYSTEIDFSKYSKVYVECEANAPSNYAYNEVLFNVIDRKTSGVYNTLTSVHKICDARTSSKIYTFSGIYEIDVTNVLSSGYIAIGLGGKPSVTPSSNIKVKSIWLV